MRQTIAALLCAAALGIACAPTARAADIPSRVYTKAPAVVADPVANWTGWYVGLNAGGNWGTSSNATTITPTGCLLCYGPPFPDIIAAAGAQSVKTSGFTGGIQGGYNWQSGRLVAGVETDFEYFRSAGSKSVTAPFVPGTASTFTVTSAVKTDWLFTLRPRVGVAANNWLFYGTGGLAVANLKANWTFRENFDPASEAGAASSTKAGWVAGGGVETMLPGNLSLGVEYLYVKFNNVSVTDTNNFFPAFGASTQPFNHSADLASNIVRVRLNHKF